MFNLSTIVGILKVSGQTAPFYAADLGIEGYTMSALSSMGAVRKTGNVREAFIQLWDDHYKRVEVHEWENCVGGFELNAVDDAVQQARRLIDLVDNPAWMRE